jgi:hypothetical protein
MICDRRFPAYRGFGQRVHRCSRCAERGLAVGRLTRPATTASDFRSGAVSRYCLRRSAERRGRSSGEAAAIHVRPAKAGQGRSCRELVKDAATKCLASIGLRGPQRPVRIVRPSLIQPATRPTKPPRTSPQPPPQHPPAETARRSSSARGGRCRRTPQRPGPRRRSSPAPGR